MKILFAGTFLGGTFVNRSLAILHMKKSACRVERIIVGLFQCYCKLSNFTKTLCPYNADRWLTNRILCHLLAISWRIAEQHMWGFNGVTHQNNKIMVLGQVTILLQNLVIKTDLFTELDTNSRARRQLMHIQVENSPRIHILQPIMIWFRGRFPSMIM